MTRLTAPAALALALFVAAETRADPADSARRCVETAGPASAGVPVSAEAARAARERLVAAQADCRAAEASQNAEALFHAATIAQLSRDGDRAFALLKRAAALGLAAAETRLGDMANFGLPPVAEDAQAAAGHYRTAAGLGDPAAQTTLALLHRIGRGVPRDTGEMVRLLQQAADAGYHFAQYRLAQVYLTGEGVPGGADPALGIPDPPRAADLLGRAAEAGNTTAALELAALYDDAAAGIGTDPESRARLIGMAAEAGDPAAVAALGVLHETGQGVAYDPARAADLYVAAMESGKVAFEELRRGAAYWWDRQTALAFQQILQDRGLYLGPLDAVVGPGTAAAARALAGD